MEMSEGDVKCRMCGGPMVCAADTCKCEACNNTVEHSEVMCEHCLKEKNMMTK